MRTGYTSAVSSQFQFTIPKAVSDVLHLKRGDRILIWEQDGEIVGQPVKTLPPHPRMSYEQAEATLRAFRKARSFGTGNQAERMLVDRFPHIPAAQPGAENRVPDGIHVRDKLFSRAFDRFYAACVRR